MGTESCGSPREIAGLPDEVAWLSFFEAKPPDNDAWFSASLEITKFQPAGRVPLTRTLLLLASAWWDWRGLASGSGSKVYRYSGGSG